jgi:hypothetical protein
MVSGSAQVSEKLPGILYIDGKEGAAFMVDADNVELVFLPTWGNELELGETVEYEGVVVDLPIGKVLDTTKGFLYRSGALTMQPKMEKQMLEAQQAAAQNMVQGIPLTVPISIFDTREQKEEKEAEAKQQASERQFNVIISLMGLVIALLAFDKVPVTVKWVCGFFRKKKAQAD